jgi:hypothetical protein
MADQRLKAARSPRGRSRLPTADLSRDLADWIAGGSRTALAVRWAGDTAARPLVAATLTNWRDSGAVTPGREENRKGCELAADECAMTNMPDSDAKAAPHPKVKGRNTKA